MWDIRNTYNNYIIKNKNVNYIFVIESFAAMSCVYIEEVNTFKRETIQRLREFNRE